MHNFASLFRLHWVLGGLVVATVLISWTGRAPETTWQKARVDRGDVEVTVTAIGNLRPKIFVDVGAQVSGQILQLHGQPGDTVQKGKLLVEIDPSVQQAAVNAGRASLAGLRAQRVEQQALLRLAEQQLVRQRAMAIDGATRDEDVERAEAELATAMARIDYFNAQITQMQATLNADEARLGFTRIYAPITGTLVTMHVREGQTLNATYQTPVVFRIADLSVMTVWTKVAEADVRRVKVGQPVRFTTLGTDAHDEPRSWASTVRQVMPAPTDPEKSTEYAEISRSAEQAVTYMTLFDVENTDRELMSQMTAQVTFTITRAQNVLSVPLAALTLVAGKPERYQARVLNYNGQPQVREVRIGVRNRTAAEVLAGLTEGETLIVADAPPPTARPWIQW